jgi:hypothetical protein
MSNNFFNKISGKTGQVGETVTWMVATIIIIVVLLISISATVIGIFDFKNFNYIKKTDVLASKSFFSYLLTESGEGTHIYEQLGSEDNLNEFNGELAVNIFKEFYEGEKEYLEVWIGIFHNRVPFHYEGNEYFGSRPSIYRGGLFGSRVVVLHITEQIILNENKSVEMALVVREYE